MNAILPASRVYGRGNAHKFDGTRTTLVKGPSGNLNAPSDLIRLTDRSRRSGSSRGRSTWPLAAHRDPPVLLSR